jgi:hypothetical protein
VRSPGGIRALGPSVLLCIALLKPAKWIVTLLRRRSLRSLILQSLRVLTRSRPSVRPEIASLFFESEICDFRQDRGGAACLAPLNKPRGKSSLTVVQTIFKSTKKYSWIAALRIPRIWAHGSPGCCLMKSGAVLLILFTASLMISMLRTIAS